jgi:hypothetical protein
MSDTILIAMLGAYAVILAAFIAGGVSLAVALARWHADNKRLWLWNRELVDHIYRQLPPPPPIPPSELFD